jgi:hypothetical protein
MSSRPGCTSVQKSAGDRVSSILARVHVLRNPPSQKPKPTIGINVLKLKIIDHVSLDGVTQTTSSATDLLPRNDELPAVVRELRTRQSVSAPPSAGRSVSGNRSNRRFRMIGAPSRQGLTAISKRPATESNPLPLKRAGCSDLPQS